MYVDLMGTEKKFIKAYDDYLLAKDRLYNAKMIYNTSYNAPLIFWKKEYIAKKRATYNLALADFDKKEKVAKMLHYSRNKFNMETPDTLSQLDMDEWNELSVWKSLFHQETTNVVKMNSKFISNDWKSEVVYDNDGNKVTNELDIWTYNFFDPIEEPWKHYDYDVRPYFEWWNGPKYKTSKIDKYIPF